MTGQGQTGRRTSGTIESRRSTAADTIFPEGLNRAYFCIFDGFVASESREVVVGKIEKRLARVDECWSGSI
jgi:hypothetical protein